MKWRALLVTISLAGVFYIRRQGAGDQEVRFKVRKILENEDSFEDPGDVELQDSFFKRGWLRNLISAEGFNEDFKDACIVNKSEDALLPKNPFTNEQMKGAIVLYIIGILYMFYAIAMVCDNYFVPTLDNVIEKFSIAPDVAGATFMAAGGSAPELFTSVIGVFIVVSDVGIGTIVGSAVFNVLFVIAACAFASKQALSLTAYPLIRDTTFYSIALAVLVYFFLDDLIKWWEALILFLWYITYVVYMAFNSFFEGNFYRMFPKLKKDDSGDVSFPAGFKGLPRKKLLLQMQDHVNAKSEGDLEMDLVGQTGLRGLKKALSLEGKTSKEYEEDEIKNHYVQPEDKKAESDDDYENPVTSGLKGNVFSKLLCIVSMPLTIPMYLTIPDPNNEKFKKFFPLSFLGSLVWIIIFTYIMVWWATEVCNFTGISDATMGITFLAAGTSVPDLITSVIVAKAGHGDMAVSSSIGSNLFDVTVGLPVPWLLYTLINSKDMVVSSVGMACNIGMLFLMLIAVFVAIVLFKWKMTKPMGVIMICLYAGFLSVALGLSECWFECFI